MRNLIVFSTTCLIPMQTFLMVEILVKDIGEFVIEFFVHKVHTSNRYIYIINIVLEKLQSVLSGSNDS